MQFKRLTVNMKYATENGVLAGPTSCTNET